MTNWTEMFLPAWIEDLVEVYIDLDKSPMARVYFHNWLIKNNYRIPKTEKEAVYRIKQYMKHNPFMARRKWSSSGTIKIINPETITNKTVRHKLS